MQGCRRDRGDEGQEDDRRSATGDHAATMLLGYLPQEKVLVEADVYTPAPAGAPAGAVVRESVNLYENIERLKLDVQQITPLHGRLVTIADLRQAIGK